MGSRLRAHDLLSLTGEVISDYWDSLSTTDPDYYDLSTDEFVATARLNAATGQNFTSWADLFGPIQDYGDSFTQVQRYNLSSFIFDVESRGGLVQKAVFGYANNPSPSAIPPYAAEDILLVSELINW